MAALLPECLRKRNKGPAQTHKTNIDILHLVCFAQKKNVRAEKLVNKLVKLHRTQLLHFADFNRD